MSKTAIFCVALLLGLILPCLPAAQPSPDSPWQPVPGHIMTPWAAQVDPAHPLPEYPRPQLVRREWTSLNGLWNYAIQPKEDAAPQAYAGKILVPFPVESALSGVGKSLKPEQRLWYRRTFQSPDLSGGKRLLLHFGAVDWEAQVKVNGQAVGTHRGGYDPFTCDITATVKPAGENELIVAVFDATGGYQPKGKQNLHAVEHPGGIMYTPTSGIWQTVWLEAVPAVAVEAIQLVPDVDAGVLRLKVELRGKADGATVEAVALDGQQEVARASGPANAEIAVPIKNAHLWTPEDPFLYGLQVTLKRGEQSLDAVESYFGMRKIAVGKDDKGLMRLLLNGKFVFQSGPLDQGFWPDGIYTAPTDEALRFDVESMKKLGFNMARKHVKVEPDRWYYWCDKLGLLVWQDMPSGGAGKNVNKDKAQGKEKGKKVRREDQEQVRVSDEAAEQFETELKALVQQHWNHPSIIMWVVFNEGWGQFETPRLTQWVKQLDPSRLVNNASGWTDQHVGDVIDMHSYPGPGCPKPEAERAAVLGEFGGLGLAIPDHTWTEKSWGYRGMDTQQALTNRYVDLWRKVWQLREEGLCAAVYTQLTDCETECNGLLTYDRKVVKVDAKLAADAIAGRFPPVPTYVPVVPTSQQEPARWRYTMQKPAEGWILPGFDASTWQEGPAGFGGGQLRDASVRTRWKTDNIWLRREITLPGGQLKNPKLTIYHDEDVEVYFNGILAAKAQGYNTAYEIFDITPAALAVLKPGKITLAVHCLQTIGGQYIDLGIVTEK